MHRLKQSFAWWCFERGGMTPEKLLHTAADIGYEGVELIDQKHWQLARDHGLTIASHGGHHSLTDGLNRREHHNAIEKEICANLELAMHWGIPNLICFSGDRKGMSDAAGAEITAEGLRRVAKAAEDAGVTLVLEMLNSIVDHKDYQADSTAWGLKVCELVDSPRVKLLYDIYHMQIMEGDIIRTIRNYHTAFAHYHTAGNPGRHDLDEQQELNYPPIMQAILATGYTGFIGQEFVPRGDVATALKATFDLCNITA